MSRHALAGPMPPVLAALSLVCITTIPYQTYPPLCMSLCPNTGSLQIAHSVGTFRLVPQPVFPAEMIASKAGRA